MLLDATRMHENTFMIQNFWDYAPQTSLVRMRLRHTCESPVNKCEHS